ncbi:MAG: 4-hydroxy-3-methylbut-2-enyl diphosphate reductase [Kiritimatiellaeota bacterium]|nr:4-hydroxy-3-methylbut-2-enyl diphosphate reductase [Kiritimatiellota bacterium]
MNDPDKTPPPLQGPGQGRGASRLGRPSAETLPTPFHDPDLEYVRKAGGVLMLGSIRLRLPRIFGFCGGVRNALRMLQNAIDGNSGQHRIWLLGEIIHNDTVNRFFRDQGVSILPEDAVESILELAAPGDLLVVPAFGLPAGLDRRLRARFGRRCRFLDTTCGYVRRVWTFVGRAAAAGRTVVIHGKPDHPETCATVSRALGERNSVVIVPDLPRADRLEAVLSGSAPLAIYPAELVRHPDFLDPRRLALASQTTMLCSETEAVAAKLRAAVTRNGGDLLPANTVCRATEQRQQAARELCSSGCDLCLVVGGLSSSNTNQLHRLARSYCPAYFIRNAVAIEHDRLRHYRPDLDREVTDTGWLPASVREIGLLSGASCPPADVGGVIRKLRDMCGEMRP